MTPQNDPSRAAWRKSRFSNGGEACVEVAVWHKSPRSTNGGNCVEVAVGERDAAETPYEAAHKADSDELYVMRDSKDPDGPRLYFTPAEWEAFRLGMKDGAFDDLA